MRDRYANVREDLHRIYGGALDAETIEAVVNEEIGRHEERATVPDFLSVMVSRSATVRLEELASCAGTVARRPEILFVSNANAGRSQLAAAIAKSIAGDAVFVRATGLHPTGEVEPAVRQVLTERGCADCVYLEPINARTVHHAGVIVLLGVQDAPNLPGDRYEQWTFPDPAGMSVEEVRTLADSIEVRVRELLKQLGVLEAAA